MIRFYKTLAFLVFLCSGQQAIAQNFITQWDLSVAGSGATQLTFLTATSGSVNYTWQELSPGSATGSGSWSGSAVTITGLPTGATIRLQIAPTNFQRIIILNGLDRNRLTQVEQWGSTTWTSMEYAFYGCTNLQVTAADVPDLSNVSSMESMFFGCTNLNSPTNIGSWNTATVTNMRFMFSYASAFNQDIGSWNTGAVTNMERMFQQGFAFNNGGNGSINNWNTGAVTNMNGMFFEAKAFNQNIGSWDTGNVTDMVAMFYDANAFNQDIGLWNTGAVTDMYQMFTEADAFNQNIGSWNTSSVINMGSMFLATSFDNGGSGSINNWNTASVTSMRLMFASASAFNQNIGSWNTEAVTDMSFMFSSASAFDQNIGAWNTAAVTDMSGMFAGANAFNRNIGGWNLNPGVVMTSMLDFCGMDCNNYSSTLIGWSVNPTTPNGRVLEATNRAYGTNAVTARTNLATTKGWTITGDFSAGIACSSGLVPTISFFNPPNGSIGETVIITGTNFDIVAANNIVKFNGINAPIPSAATATSLTVTVPVGATTGQLSVTTPDGTGLSSSNFVVTKNFITQWDLSISGSSPTELSFGTATSGPVNYTWQEISPGSATGSATGSGSWSGATLTITGLPADAIIRLQIEPTNFQRIIINNGPDRERLTQVENWGSTAWTSMQNAFGSGFGGCTNLQITATDFPNLAGVADMSYMFSGCTLLNSPSNINSWNTMSVTNMEAMFSQASSFNQNIGAWNTGAVTNMQAMFGGASAFNQNIGAWNTGTVTNLQAMFSQAYAFNQDIGAWNTGAVTSMGFMFYGAIAFNQNIGAWNTGVVSDMQYMFAQAYAFNQDIGAWNTAAVTNMEGMFYRADTFNRDIGAWNTTAVTNMSYMFSRASAFNQNIGNWNTGSVTNMSGMFRQASSFNQNTSNWNTATVTDMSLMFSLASAFNQNIGAWTLDPGVNLSNMLDNSGMDCNNYSATLIGWSANASTPNGRFFGASGRQYGTNAVAARTNLTTTKGWTITGDTPSGAVCTPLASVPTITSFTPISGPTGTTVTITGTNFDTTPANNIVMFHGTAATVTASTSTSITATVPTGATTGPISVTVGGNTATSATNFTVAPFNISYTAPLSVTVGTTPREVVVGDIDGDGHKDLVVSNFGSGSISFLKGIGNGCLQSAQNFNTGPNSHGLALADLNQDSRLDLVVTKGSNSTSFTSLSVLLGNGVSFDPQNDYTTAPIPRSPNHITIGDMNKDGSLDIVVANNNPSGSFSILYNNGNGTFATGVDFPSINGPAFFVATDDVNGDTYPDVAIASYYNNTAGIYINNGLGGFAPETTYPSAGGPHYVLLKDLNGDNRPEMIVANALANSISVFLNNGTGSFSPPAIYATGNYPTTLSVADLDNDGKLDLVVGNANSGSITALPGDGAGGFGASQNFSVGGQPYSIATGDFDEDGKLDIVSVDLSSNKVTLLRTLSSSNCIPPSITSFSPATGSIGTTVTITGTNFDPVAANNTVAFNGVTAVTPSAASITSLTVTVPVGATTGPLSVTTLAGTGTSSTNFTVTCIPPTPPAAPSVSRCGNGTVTLSATGTIGTQEYRWYDVASSGTSQSSIATFTTPSLTTTTSFYVSIFDVATSCESGRTPVDAIINTPPPAPLGVNNSGCSGTSISVSATGSSAGQYRWFTIPTGGTPIAGQTNDTFLTPNLTATSSYYVSINDGTCESSRTEVIATVLPLPASPSVTPAAACGPQAVALAAAGAATGDYRWYESGTPIPGAVNSTYLTPTLSATTVYEVAIFNGTCESNRTPVTATIHTVPGLPTLNDESRCGPGTITLTASGATASQEYRWYEVPTGGTQLAVAGTYTTPALSATTTYYVSLVDTGTGCEGPREAVDAIINLIPAAPINPVNGTGCAGTSITLSVSGGLPGQYRWYATPTGGLPDAAQTDNTFVTGPLTNPTSYWAAINDGCESSRTEVIAQVLALPAAPAEQPAAAVCSGSGITLTASGGTNGQYRWYNDTGTLIAGEVNNTLTVSNLTLSKIYQVALFNGTCESIKTNVAATVKPCSPPVISTTSLQASLEETVVIDLEPLITDPEDDLDESSLQVVSLKSQAPFTLNGFILSIAYAGNFAGTDEVTLLVCDVTSLCTTQTLTLELDGDLTFYNALSPNGDGRNDTFYIKNIDLLPDAKENQVRIFNRDGALVWEVENYDNATRVFAGVSNDNQELPSGTYYYKVRITATQTMLTGFIELKR